MSGSRSTEPESTEDGRLSPELIGVAVGVLTVPVFAYLGLELFGDPAFGAFVGLVIGLGIFLSAPAFMADDEEQSDATATPVAIGDRLRQFHRTAAGLALPPAGVLLFSWRLVPGASLLSVLVIPVITAVIYVSLAVLLPQQFS
ncbi:hypothetical protein [Natrinema sp. SYSU A 869]|uniref:hypothetical protein n=1 Tax=Natrinema sp. SYSU A 869 TaxID=2871694 RepID=UPI001CA46432|nr:hypothetical protein [Natrinema sp. SYSU A 869]